jgi:hypothetical protein
VVLSREEIGHEVAGADLDLPHRLQLLAREHDPDYGTGTPSKTRFTTSSASISSASAS